MDNNKNKPLAYYYKVVQNSLKNEYRSNANARKYMFPSGISFDGCEADFTDDIMEEILSEDSVENWMMFIENQNLYIGLSSLKEKDREFVFTMFSNGYNQSQMAEYLNVSQAMVNKRLHRILKRLKQFF